MAMSKLALIRRALDRAKMAEKDATEARRLARKAGVRSPSLDAAVANAKATKTDLLLAQERARASNE